MQEDTGLGSRGEILSGGLHYLREDCRQPRLADGLATTKPTGMFMCINSASSFNLLSFLDTMRGLYEWVHTRQLIVIMRVHGLLTPNRNEDGFSEARPGLVGLNMT